MDIMTYTIVAIVIVIFAFYIVTQIKLSKKIALKDTTLENIEEKLKKHKLKGGRHKRTNKKNPPII